MKRPRTVLSGLEKASLGLLLWSQIEISLSLPRTEGLVHTVYLIFVKKYMKLRESQGNIFI